MDRIIGDPTAGGLNGPDSQPGRAAPGELIKESDTQNFMQDVIEASQHQPVLVDFWATWCGPCKQLTPVLEKAVTQARGAVRLVKIDIDQNQALAQQLQIQSVPTVFAFYQGQPVDGFQGALPESQIKSFIDRLVQMAGGANNQIEELLARAEELRAAGDPGQALELFAAILQHEPEENRALVGLLRCQIDLGEHEEARAQFEELPAELRESAELAPIKTALDLAAQTAEAGDVAGLQEKVAQDPADHQARFDLSQALYATGEREAACNELLEIIRRERAWNDDAARKELLKYFEAWGATDPLTVETRRRLSSLLFA
jgi:putative thioredoxin